MRTYTPKGGEITRQWHVIDATDVVLGRLASQAAIRETRQSLQKWAWDPIEDPVSMQLVGCTPLEMGEAAKLSEDRGAAIVDINMGCPAKKVCHAWAGSALMRDEPGALAIVEAVVAACAPRGVPVTRPSG